MFMMHIAMILDNDASVYGTYMFVACIYDELNFKYKTFIFILICTTTGVSDWEIRGGDSVCLTGLGWGDLFVFKR